MFWLFLHKTVLFLVRVAGAQPPRGSGRSPEHVQRCSFFPSGGAGGGFGAPTPWSAFEHMPVVEEAVQHRGDGGHVAQQFSPVVDGAV